MSEYSFLREELLKLKEKDINLSPEIISRVIKEKINDKNTKRILYLVLALSITIFLIFIFRRKNWKEKRL